MLDQIGQIVIKTKVDSSAQHTNNNNNNNKNKSQAVLPFWYGPTLDVLSDLEGFEMGSTWTDFLGCCNIIRSHQVASGTTPQLWLN